MAHYTIVRELGRGAQGIVYLAEDTRLHRKVALKVLTAAGAQSKAIRDRFQREAEITSKLDHPGICGVHEVGEADALPYIAMQYVRGTTLAALLDQARASQPGADSSGQLRADATISVGGGTGRGKLQNIMRLMERAAHALHAAHEAGLVHRDIKPGNLMITPEGDPVWLDFGLARDLGDEGQTLTQSGQIMGTPAYLAPEQIRGDRDVVDRRADIYAMGVTLYECVTLSRPFDAPTWDQLFHQILEGNAKDPRKRNPRIPRDLRTVIETAMDVDPKRRFPNALSLAEDLNRASSFIPIRAKAAGPLLRSLKWSRRNPVKATSIAAAVAFVIAGGTYLAGQGLARQRAVRERLEHAANLLGQQNFKEALAAVAQASERDPSSTAALTLKAQIEKAQEQADTTARKTADLAGAATARNESAEIERRYAAARVSIDSLRQQIAAESGELSSRFAPDDVRGRFAGRQQELRNQEARAEGLLLESREALERAARLESRWGGPTAATEFAVADLYLRRWREAVASGDPARATAYRSAVEAHDRDGRHRVELLGRGTLSISVVPPDAELFLFRYESYETVRADHPIPRLVPVPTSGIGRVREADWCDGFHPGDPCFVIRGVESGSPAARAGLRTGDLVIRIDGQACGGGVLLRRAPGSGPLAIAGARPLQQIESLNDVPIGDWFDWRNAARASGESAPDRLRLAGAATEIAISRAQVDCAPALQLLHEPMTAAAELTCLRAGNPIVLAVAAGERAGVTCEATAYPLVCASANRVTSAVVHAADPGSYLLLARHDGFEDQRMPVVVARGGAATTAISLQPVGTTPAGFVYVPPGPFRYGGDPDAFKAVPTEEREQPGFVIARKELTNREWFEFVNDEQTLAKIAKDAKDAKSIYLPTSRGGEDVLYRQRPDGSYEWWGPRSKPSGETPVFGISWNATQAWLEWRNRRARADGEAWTYALPTQAEWEKAARGVDGRAFPWGNRFDPSLTVCLPHRRAYLLDEPGGFQPRDESPFGILDLGGSRDEWTSDAVDRHSEPAYNRRGGHWGSFVEALFRSASRAESNADYAASSTGFRLVLRPYRAQ